MLTGPTQYPVGTDRRGWRPAWGVLEVTEIELPAMFFDHLDAADVEPKQLVGRARDAQWLRELLSRYLQAAEHDAGRAACLVGEKGVGKSILARSVLEDLKTRFAASTLFAVVDCRSCHSWRGVISAVAAAVVAELSSLQRASADVAEALMATAKLVRALTLYDRIELKAAHAQTLQFQAATGLRGSQETLNSVRLNFGLSLKLNAVQIRSMMGAVCFDDAGLTDALMALFRDLRSQGFNAVVLLDNLDELRHEYRDTVARERVRREVDGVLRLKQAPIALVLTLRDYYAGAIERTVSHVRVLQPLAPAELLALLDRRLVYERPEAQAALGAARPLIEQLADIAPTPLAFLSWVKFLLEEGMLSRRRLSAGFRAFLETQYVNLDPDTLKALVEALPTPGAPIDRATLLAACAGDEALLETLQDRRVVMPDDFWHPGRFTLDPELFALHPAAGFFAPGPLAAEPEDAPAAESFVDGPPPGAPRS